MIVFSEIFFTGSYKSFCIAIVIVLVSKYGSLYNTGVNLLCSTATG